MWSPSSRDENSANARQNDVEPAIFLDKSHAQYINKTSSGRAGRLRGKRATKKKKKHRRLERQREKTQGLWFLSTCCCISSTSSSTSSSASSSTSSNTRGNRSRSLLLFLRLSQPLLLSVARLQASPTGTAVFLPLGLSVCLSLFPDFSVPTQPQDAAASFVPPVLHDCMKPAPSSEASNTQKISRLFFFVSFSPSTRAAPFPSPSLSCSYVCPFHQHSFSFTFLYASYHNVFKFLYPTTTEKNLGREVQKESFQKY